LAAYKDKALKALKQSNERVDVLTKENFRVKENCNGYRKDAEDAR